MPTVHREHGFAFRIYPNDHEPPHVHVYRAGSVVKVEVPTGAVLEVRGMRDADVARVVRVVQQNRETFLSKWREIHGR